MFSTIEIILITSIMAVLTYGHIVAYTISKENKKTRKLIQKSIEILNSK